jgi:hypothetical protein
MPSKGIPCARSSVDRASASGAEGRKFESCRARLRIACNKPFCWTASWAACSQFLGVTSSRPSRRVAVT